MFDGMPQPRVEFRILPAARLRLVRLIGDVGGALALARLNEALAAHPAAGSYAGICDLRQHRGRLDLDAIRAMHALLLGMDSRRDPCRDAWLSHDRGMVFLARYANHLRPHVSHIVTVDPVEACVWALGSPPPPEALAFLAED